MTIGPDQNPKGHSYAWQHCMSSLFLYSWHLPLLFRRQGSSWLKFNTFLFWGSIIMILLVPFLYHNMALTVCCSVLTGAEPPLHWFNYTCIKSETTNWPPLENLSREPRKDLIPFREAARIWDFSSNSESWKLLRKDKFSRRMSWETWSPFLGGRFQHHSCSINSCLLAVRRHLRHKHAVVTHLSTYSLAVYSTVLTFRTVLLERNGLYVHDVCVQSAEDTYVEKNYVEKKKQSASVCMLLKA